uniref:Uncharacterized protein n=1 Tax=Talaromyces marneffei PM1 TaxID=1077442 RepID=A0A093XT33_TALMA
MVVGTSCMPYTGEYTSRLSPPAPSPAGVCAVS